MKIKSPSNTTRSKPNSAVRHRKDQADAPAIICDLAEGEAFAQSFRKPHIPVMSAFGAGRLHMFRFSGAWDLNRMMADHAGALFRSIRMLASNDVPAATAKWDDLTFRFGPQAFIYADETRIIGFASSAAAAEQLAKGFGAKYGKPKPPAQAGGIFHLIEQAGDKITTKEVALSPDTVLSPEDIELHYGAGSVTWHQGFVAKLRSRTNGLSIFEGKPGTGKTFYLRHLMGELKESHRFYFIPTATQGILSNPNCVGFWSTERWQHADKQFVVILEDSDEALMARGADNRAEVSALLNLTDGMLGDFLRLQIICTINCSATDIDPALLRPGRLLGHRVFGRLNHSQAIRLAESLGRELPMPGDYSIAEVYAGQSFNPVPRPRVGFAA